MAVVDEEIRKRLSLVGNIIVEFHWCFSTGLVDSDETEIEMPGHGTVPEKAVKGTSLSHFTRYEYPQASRNLVTTHVHITLA
jgi:hypothetical protein